jgi:hypothetical protein
MRFAVTTPLKWGNKKSAELCLRFPGGVKYFLILRYGTNAVIVFFISALLPA